MSPAAVGVPGALVATAAGVGLIRVSWRRRLASGWIAAGGWALLLAAIPLWALAAAWDKAAALALLAPSLAALLLVAANLEVRPRKAAKPPRVGAELPDRSGDGLWRGLARTALGGPGAGMGALLLAAAWALKGPGPAEDRLGEALYLGPMLWALGLVWATTDPRLLRVGGGLVGLALLGIAWSRS